MQRSSESQSNNGWISRKRDAIGSYDIVEFNGQGARVRFNGSE